MKHFQNKPSLLQRIFKFTRLEKDRDKDKDKDKDKKKNIQDVGIFEKHGGALDSGAARESVTPRKLQRRNTDTWNVRSKLRDGRVVMV